MLPPRARGEPGEQTERRTGARLGGALLGFAGVAIISVHQASVAAPAGVLLLLGSSLAWTAGTLLTSAARQPVVAIAGGQHLVGAPLVSPLLANVFVHHVVDLWAHHWSRRHARGDVVIVRYADDYIVGFQHQRDAQGFLADLRDMLAAFGLELAGEKTRLIESGRFAAENRAARGQRKPETFNLLGFTHMCSKTRNGRFMLKRITAARRMRAQVVRFRALDASTISTWSPSLLTGGGIPTLEGPNAP